MLTDSQYTAAVDALEKRMKGWEGYIDTSCTMTRDGLQIDLPWREIAAWAIEEIMTLDPQHLDGTTDG